MDSGFSCRSLVNKAINMDYRHPNDPTLQGSSYVSCRAPCLGTGTLHFYLCTNIMAHGRWPIVRRPAYTCIAYISLRGLAADCGRQLLVIIHYPWPIFSYVLWIQWIFNNGCQVNILLWSLVAIVLYNSGGPTILLIPLRYYPRQTTSHIHTYIFTI